MEKHIPGAQRITQKMYLGPGLEPHAHRVTGNERLRYYPFRRHDTEELNASVSRIFAKVT
jgi:hypothetical protein